MDTTAVPCKSSKGQELESINGVIKPILADTFERKRLTWAGDTIQRLAFLTKPDPDILKVLVKCDFVENPHGAHKHYSTCWDIKDSYANRIICDHIQRMMLAKQDRLLQEHDALRKRPENYEWTP